MAGFFNFRKQGPLMFRAPKAKTFVSGNATRTKRPSRPMKRKRTFKGKGRKSSRKVRKTAMSRLSSRVSKLSKGVDATTGLLTHRQLHVASLTVAEGVTRVGQLILNSSVRNIDSLAIVPYFNSDGGTIVDIDASSPLYQNQFRIQSVFLKASMINNTVSSITVRVGIMTPKNDTDIGPFAAFNAGLTDIGVPLTDALVRFSDSQVLGDLWSFAPGTYKEVTLSPGAHYDVTLSLGGYDYQVATNQSDDLAYRVANKPAVLIYQVRGAIHTDVNNSTQINFSTANVTVTALVTRKISYAAGANIQRTILVNNDTTEFSTAGVQANQPEAVLQSL